jgi:hypothetical protein
MKKYLQSEQIPQLKSLFLSVAHGFLAFEGHRTSQETSQACLKHFAVQQVSYALDDGAKGWRNARNH